MSTYITMKVMNHIHDRVEQLNNSLQTAVRFRQYVKDIDAVTDQYKQWGYSIEDITDKDNSDVGTTTVLAIRTIQKINIVLVFSTERMYNLYEHKVISENLDFWGYKLDWSGVGGNEQTVLDEGIKQYDCIVLDNYSIKDIVKDKPTHILPIISTNKLSKLKFIYNANSIYKSGEKELIAYEQDGEQYIVANRKLASMYNFNTISIREVDFNTFYTDNITHLFSLFMRSGLEKAELDFSIFKNKILDTSFMLSFATIGPKVDIESLDTSKVRTADGMFWTSRLQKIPSISLTLPLVRSMQQTFKLAAFNKIELKDIQNLRQAEALFQNSKGKEVKFTDCHIGKEANLKNLFLEAHIDRLVFENTVIDKEANIDYSFNDTEIKEIIIKNSSIPSIISLIGWDERIKIIEE